MVSKSSKVNDTEFTNKALGYMPRWAWAFCSILLALSFSIRQIGLDVTTPFNRIMTAYAIRIEQQQKCSNEIDYSEVIKRIVELEKYSHKPSHNK
ncbi:hypothetical protein [Hahella chejuensis]|uniref:hypothetical protein n=1 Tax=Hahella chejuensis TaxID=158327 RepID=UPI0011D0E3BA|nr:hypothetical protein [Hahella chejuensis]